MVIPLSHTDNPGEHQEVEPPRLLGAALDPHRGQESAGGKEDPSSKQDFVELSLESNGEGSSDLLRSPAGPDGQRRRNRTDTMIFSEAVNIAEDLAKAQTEAELEGSTPFTEDLAIDEVAEVPFISEDISLTGDAAPVSSDLSPEFDDQVLTDEVEEIPLPSVVDLELAVHEDSGEESSDEEVVSEEEILDPTVAKLPISPEIPGLEPPLTVATEPSISETASDEKEPETTGIPEPVQSTPEASKPPAEVEVTPVTTDDGEDVEEDEEEEESTSPLEPPPPVIVVHDGGGDDGDDDDCDDDDDGGDDDDGSQPANQPEAGS